MRVEYCESRPATRQLVLTLSRDYCHTVEAPWVTLYAYKSILDRLAARVGWHARVHGSRRHP